MINNSKIEEDIKKILEKLEKICIVLGIGTVPPAKIIELRKKARDEVKKIHGNQEDK